LRLLEHTGDYTRKEKKGAALPGKNDYDAKYAKGTALRFRKLLVPAGEGALTEKGSGSPIAEVDGEGYAVAGVGACKDQVFVAWMGAEDGDEISCEKDGAAPAVSDADGFEGRMQRAHTLFEQF